MDRATYDALLIFGAVLGIFPWIALYLCAWKRSLIALPCFDRVFGASKSPPGLSGSLKFIVMVGLLSLFMNVVLFLALLPGKVGWNQFPKYCVVPRTGMGLLQIGNAAWYHFGFMHYAMNNFALWTLGPLVLSYNRRTFVSSMFFIAFVGGLAQWLVGPSNTCAAGFSGIVFGWYGLLTLALVLECPPRWWRVLLLLVVGAFLGASAFSEVFEGDNEEGISWHSHVCGFAAGVVFAYLRFRRGWFLYEGMEDRVRPAGSEWPGLCVLLARMASESATATWGAVSDIRLIICCRGPATSSVAKCGTGTAAPAPTPAPANGPQTFGKFTDQA